MKTEKLAQNLRKFLSGFQNQKTTIIKEKPLRIIFLCCGIRGWHVARKKRKEKDVQAFPILFTIFPFTFKLLIVNTGSLFWALGIKLLNDITGEHQPLPRYNVQQGIKFTLYLDNRSPYPFVYFNLRNPYPFICLKPENWYPFFGRDLLVYAIIMGTAPSRSGWVNKLRERAGRGSVLWLCHFWFRSARGFARRL